MRVRHFLRCLAVFQQPVRGRLPGNNIPNFRIQPLIYKTLALITALSINSVIAQERGEVYEGSITIKDHQNRSTVYVIPIPDGKWTIESITNRSSGGSAAARMKDVRLTRVALGVLQEALEITVKTESSNVNWNDEPCKIDPVLYRNDYGTRLWKQKCLTIAPETFLQGNNEPTRVTLKEFSDRGVKHDFNSISAKYTRYGDYGKFLVIKHHFFPSNYGLDNPTVGIINTSPYHPASISRDENKKMMIDALAKYMESSVQAYDISYDGGKPKRLSKFEWPIDENKGNATEKQDLLNKAFSAGLISKEDFDRQRSELISR